MSYTWKETGDLVLSILGDKVATGMLVLTTMGVIPVIGHLLDLNTTAYAQDKAAKQAPAKVPMMDARNMSATAVMAGGVAQSDNSIVVAFYGTDQQLLNDTIKALGQAIQKGIPVRGLIIGPTSKSGIEGPYSKTPIEVYAKGLLTSPATMKWDKDALREMLEFANVEYIQSGRFELAPVSVP